MSTKKLPQVRECLAWERCRQQGRGCDACLQLSSQAWKEHVAKVLQ